MTGDNTIVGLPYMGTMINTWKNMSEEDDELISSFTCVQCTFLVPSLKHQMKATKH